MIINQDYRRDSDANSQVTNMNVGAVFSGGNILSSYGNTIYIKSQTCLLNRYELRLYNEYYPCAYSDKFDFEKSISLLDIIKSYYDSDVVVNDISFYMDKGEVVCLLGPNGAGKTTTFYMIVGLVKPNSGCVLVDNKEITDWPMNLRAKAGIGYLPQENSIFRKFKSFDKIIYTI